MTTVYNVTVYGASLQIKKQLPETGLDSQAGLYLARKVFSSIGELFKSAREIQVNYFISSSK
jgi:DNA-directed RNA polymerase